MGTEAEKPSPSGGRSPSTPASDDLPERWGAQRKMELVLRLLCGESLDAVPRESQVPAHELESWHRVFLEHGKRGLRTKAVSEERDLILARAKIGELMMRLELAESTAPDFLGHPIMGGSPHGRREVTVDADPLPAWPRTR